MHASACLLPVSLLYVEGLPADFELYAGPGLAQCKIIMCDKEEGGVAWVEVATTPAAECAGQASQSVSMFAWVGGG